MSPAVAPLHFGASAPAWARALELEAWDLSFASPRRTLAPASALPQGQLCACAPSGLLVPLHHIFTLSWVPLVSVNLVVAEYRKLERSVGLSNPFVAASR